MNVGIVGLGRMGSEIAYRLHKHGFTVFGFDVVAPSVAVIQESNITIVSSLQALAAQSDIFWLMVPAQAVDETLQGILPHVKSSHIIIDGGNSHYLESMRRAQQCLQKNIEFLDCGVSGGILGKEQGFSLMIGGNKKSFERCESLFKALAAPQGYAYLGRSGAGHYVKMIHNGIEYGLLQAYSEGFQLIKQGSFKGDDLDLVAITKVWNNGAVIRSWILELSQNIFEKDQKFTHISGAIEEHGTGRWTVDEAHKYHIPVPVIEESLKVRAWSRKTGGNYATKIIALLRHAFGGHKVTRLR